MGMSWGDYGTLSDAGNSRYGVVGREAEAPNPMPSGPASLSVLEGAGLRGYGLGEPSPQPGVFTGPFRAPAPPSALTETGESPSPAGPSGMVKTVSRVTYGTCEDWDTGALRPSSSPVSVSALSGAAVSPHQQEPGPPGSPAVPPLTEAGGTTAHDPAAAPLSALTEGERGRVKAADDEPSSSPSVSALVALDAVRAQP